MAKLEWMNVDPADIKDADTKKAWDAYQKAGENFEATFVKAARKAKALTDKETLKFSYKYGKIGVAKTEVGAGGAGGSFAI